MSQRVLLRLALTWVVVLTLGVVLLTVVLVWPAWRQYNIAAALQKHDLVTEYGYRYTPDPPTWWPVSWSEEYWTRRGYLPLDMSDDFGDPDGKVVRVWVPADVVERRW